MAMLLLFSGEKVLGRRVFHGKQAAWYGPSGMRQWLEGSGGVTHYCPIVFPPDPPESEANDVW